MARRSSVAKLPLEVQEQLDDRVRKASYGNLDEHLEWLQEEGQKMSRSALGRHVQALRRADSSLGNPRARVAEVRASLPRDRAGLLRELGRLQLAQARIITLLQAMGDTGMDEDLVDTQEAGSS